MLQKHEMLMLLARLGAHHRLCGWLDPCLAEQPTSRTGTGVYISNVMTSSCNVRPKNALVQSVQTKIHQTILD